MNRSKRFAAFAAAAAIAAGVTLTGCSSSDSDTPSASTSADPASSNTLNAAADATAALTGTHFALKLDGKVQGVNASAVNADIQTKPTVAAKGTATLHMGEKNTDAPFVYVNDHMYANVDGKGFIDYGDGRSVYDVSKVLDDQKGVPAVLRKVKGAKTDGDETVNGVAATKVSGTVASADLSSLTGLSDKANVLDADVPVTVWVTKDGKNNVVRMKAEPAKDSTLTIDLSEPNMKVKVTKPADVKQPSVKPTKKTDGPTREPAA